MIRRLSGTIVDVTAERIVVDVHGVGYLVHTTADRFVRNEHVALYTYLAVRETALDLYGFLNNDELELFELLLTLPKIGPKSAQQILRQASTGLLREAIAKQDAVYLSKMSGIGKKSAEKIVTGLKDKLEDVAFSIENETSGTGGGNTHHPDVVDALIALGYTPQQARAAAAALPEGVTSTAEAVKLALTKIE